MRELVVSKGKEIDNNLFIIPTMLFPENEELCVQYISHLNCRSLVDEAKDYNQDLISIDPYYIEALLNAPKSDEIKRRANIAYKAGVIAGELLAYMYVLNAVDYNEPSFSKALHIAGNVNKNRQYIDGTKYPSSEKQLRKHWKDYKSVAHLWGALSLLNEYVDKNTDTLEPIRSKSEIKLLSWAKKMCDFGEEFVPFRTTPPKPILDVDVWRIPDSYPCVDYHLHVDNLPQYMQDALSTLHLRHKVICDSI